MQCHAAALSMPRLFRCTMGKRIRARCEKCDFDSLTSEWAVLVVVVLLVLAFLASVVHPVGRARWAAIGMWLKLKEGTLFTLNGKLGVLVQT